MLRFITRSSFGTKDAFQRLFSTSHLQSRLAGKVAVITGAASGVGKATATEFIRQGAHVILADIQHDAGQAIAVGLGPNATFAFCDVTKESDISTTISLAVKTYGHVDIVYNNAGIAGSLTPSVTELNIEDFDKVMAVNVRSVVTGIKHAAKVMIPRKTGCILCTASVTGILGGMAPIDYTVSKTAVVGAVRAAAAELCKYGIRVNCISPHALPTAFGVKAMMQVLPGVTEERVVEMIYATGELEGARCEPEDVAKAAVFLASDDAKYISGHNLVVDGGFTVNKKFDFPPPQ
ncbi:Short-chain dehydrogenase/reductase SDR protein [Dioscorea alata]|uniref:Short-chain dehydrogenase/reductase SDR protein n=1 Tax=Dioscorea alata TaxID=55571 RepID=A0ACB7VQU4_DIOAL|nr:Short-chain dehydrogenase/reductase SDR protein [Dioscorea alata]